MHTLGIPWVGTPRGLAGSLNRKTGVRNSIVSEHSLLAAEAGDEPVVLRALEGFCEEANGHALLSGGKSLVLIRLSQFQMLC